MLRQYLSLDVISAQSVGEVLLGVLRQWSWEWRTQPVKNPLTVSLEVPAHDHLTILPRIPSVGPTICSVRHFACLSPIRKFRKNILIDSAHYITPEIPMRIAKYTNPATFSSLRKKVLLIGFFVSFSAFKVVQLLFRQSSLVRQDLHNFESYWLNFRARQPNFCKLRKFFTSFSDLAGVDVVGPQTSNRSGVTPKACKRTLNQESPLKHESFG